MYMNHKISVAQYELILSCLRKTITSNGIFQTKLASCPYSLMLPFNTGIASFVAFLLFNFFSYRSVCKSVLDTLAHQVPKRLYLLVFSENDSQGLFHKMWTFIKHFFVLMDRIKKKIIM